MLTWPRSARNWPLTRKAEKLFSGRRDSMAMTRERLVDNTRWGQGYFLTLWKLSGRGGDRYSRGGIALLAWTSLVCVCAPAVKFPSILNNRCSTDRQSISGQHHSGTLSDRDGRLRDWSFGVSHGMGRRWMRTRKAVLSGSMRQDRRSAHFLS